MISIVMKHSKAKNCGNSPDLKSWKKRAEERMNKSKVLACVYCLLVGSCEKIEKKIQPSVRAIQQNSYQLVLQ